MSTTLERNSGKLPASVNLPSRGAQITIGILALLGTAALVIGVPILLWQAFGTPWPDQAPSMDWVTAPTTSESILGVLAAVVWLAWAHFVLCLIVEAIAERRRRGLAPSVPGGGLGTQALARRLVAAIALIAGATATTVGPASAAVAASGPQHHVTTSVTTSVSSPAVSSQVQASATSGAQATSMADLVVQGALPAAEQLVAATAADVDAGIATYYEVKPPEGRNYDTMWDIAERYLGSGVRYKEVWELNKHLTQADGRTLSDANLIHPGWVLQLPNDARGAGLKVVEHVAPSGPSSPASGPVIEGAGAVDTADVAVADEASSFAVGDWAPLFGVGGGLALAGAYLGLRRRRAALSSTSLWADAVRRTGGAPDPTDPTDPSGPGGPGGPGARLRDEASTSMAAWLDRAVRSLGGQLAAAGSAQPSRALVGPSGLAVAFDAEVEEPAEPWTAAGQRTWTLARSANPRVGAGSASVLPGLVTVGSQDDQTLVLVDPESVGGLVALSGDPSQARGLAISMAVDTATHPWADERRVHMVGFADDLTSIGQGAIRRTDDLGQLLDELDNQARFQRNLCRTAGVNSVREARLASPQACTYHLVICSGLPNAEEGERLAALAADPAVAIAVVVIGEHPEAAMTLAARADGTLTAPHHGIEARTQVLSRPALKQLMDLYDVQEGPRSATLDQLAERVSTASFPADSADAAVRVSVLGPIGVQAPGESDKQRRDLLTELVCLLAVNPDGVHANRISAALWPRGVDAAVRDTLLQHAGQWLGTTAAGEPVLQHDSGVWRLRPGAVATDWDDFRAALNAAADHPQQAAQHLRAALGIVAGLPFQDAPSGRYSWLESTSLVADMLLAITLTTTAVVELAVSSGDLAAAREHLGRGLELMPANEEFWVSLLQLEARADDGAALRDTADRMYAAIAEYGSPVGASARTDALVDELLPGYRRRSA